MGVVVMRGLAVLLFLFSLSQEGSGQEFVGVNGVRYKVIIPPDATATPTAICQGDTDYPHVAVFGDKATYKKLISDMAAASNAQVPDDVRYYVGIKKDAGEANMGTLGGSKAPIVSFIGKTFTLATAGCAYFDFDDDAATPFEQAEWDLDTSPSCLVSGSGGNGDGVICMDTVDATCTVDCVGDGYSRPISPPYCFWNPHPYNVFTHLMAKKVCMESGGTLMNLYDDSDITNVLHNTNDPIVDDKQSYNGYWIGWSQKAGKGVPSWTNGKCADLSAIYWADNINYGSSLMLTQYAAIYDARDREINIWNTAPQVIGTDHRFNREAFILCEATHENFCKAVSPEVDHAGKTVYTESGSVLKLRYTCKAGFMVAPDNPHDYVMETTQNFTCNCNALALAQLAVKKCILKNPCYNNPCYGHSYCVFTNEYHKSYYCLCKKGYEMGPDKRCRDINECATNPCGSYYGSCYNTDGSYFCQCSKGYGWDNSGKCSAAGPPGAASMMLYFNVRMDYNSEMNNPASEIYQSIDAALRELVNYVYGSRVNLDSFYISSPSTGTIKIKITLTLYSNMDVKELSHLAYMFYTYTSSSPSFRVGSNTYPYLPGVYFESPSVTRQILVDNICSLYSGLNYCHGSPCVGEGEYPKCSCRYGYEGEYCDHEISGPNTPYIGDLSSVEIGLIIAVVILFIMVICMPIIIVCCCIPMRRSYPRAAPPPEYYSPGPPPARRFYGILPARKFF